MMTVDKVSRMMMDAETAESCAMEVRHALEALLADREFTDAAAVIDDLRAECRRARRSEAEAKAEMYAMQIHMAALEGALAAALAH